MDYINEKSAMSYTEEEFINAMGVLDQEGENKEANIEDIKRVLGTYSVMDQEQIEHFIQINQDGEDLRATDILKRITPDSKEQRKEIISYLGTSYRGLNRMSTIMNVPSPQQFKQSTTPKR